MPGRKPLVQLTSQKQTKSRAFSYILNQPFSKIDGGAHARAAEETGTSPPPRLPVPPPASPVVASPRSGAEADWHALTLTQQSPSAAVGRKRLDHALYKLLAS